MYILSLFLKKYLVNCYVRENILHIYISFLPTTVATIYIVKPFKVAKYFPSKKYLGSTFFSF